MLPLPLLPLAATACCRAASVAASCSSFPVPVGSRNSRLPQAAAGHQAPGQQESQGLDGRRLDNWKEQPKGQRASRSMHRDSSPASQEPVLPAAKHPGPPFSHLPPGRAETRGTRPRRTPPPPAASCACSAPSAPPTAARCRRLRVWRGGQAAGSDTRLWRCMFGTDRNTPCLAPQRNRRQRQSQPRILSLLPPRRHPHPPAPPMAAPEPESSHWPVGSGDSERTALVCPLYCTASVTGKGCRSLGLGSLGTSTSGSAERGVPKWLHQGVANLGAWQPALNLAWGSAARLLSWAVSRRMSLAACPSWCGPSSPAFPPVNQPASPRCPAPPTLNDEALAAGAGAEVQVQAALKALLDEGGVGGHLRLCRERMQFKMRSRCACPGQQPGNHTAFSAMPLPPEGAKPAELTRRRLS